MDYHRNSSEQISNITKKTLIERKGNGRGTYEEKILMLMKKIAVS